MGDGLDAGGWCFSLMLEIPIAVGLGYWARRGRVVSGGAGGACGSPKTAQAGRPTHFPAEGSAVDFDQVGPTVA